MSKSSSSSSSGGPTKVIAELSIEETNKIRASLGLKPLDISSSTTKNTSNTNNNNNNNHNSHFKDSNLVDAIEQLKKKREKQQQLQTKSKTIAEQQLGDDDENDDDDDVSSWIQKSRAKQQASTKSIKQPQKKGGIRGVETNDKENNNNGNIKVMNRLENIADGNEHILVLKDSNVLDDEEGDQLIDIKLAENENRQRLLEGSKKKSQYDKFDEYGQQNKILEQYDDNYNQISGFMINNSTGSLVGRGDESNENGKSSEDIKKRLEQQLSYDLQSNSVLQSSFYTQEEMDQFKKPKGRGGIEKKKKKKSVRKREEKGEDEEQDSKPFSLSDLDATTSSDLGSRRSRKAMADDIQLENQIQQRELNYQKAVEKASTQSKAVFSSFDEEAEDESFYQSLQKAKKATIKPKDTNIVDIVKNNLKKKQQSKQDHNNDEISQEGEDDTFLTSTTEFVRSLNSEGLVSKLYKNNTPLEQEEQSTETTNDNHDDDDDIMMQENKNDEDDDDNEEEDDEYDKNPSPHHLQQQLQQPSINSNSQKSGGNTNLIIPEEPMVSGSMSAALRLLIQKGELKPQEKSKRKLASFDDDDTIIQLKDEFGRIMDRKEAYIALSQKFHGKKSGLNKMEKRRRQYEQELQQKKMSSTDTPLGMMKSFQTLQEQTSSPYLVLSGGMNSGDNLLGAVLQRNNNHNNNNIQQPNKK